MAPSSGIPRFSSQSYWSLQRPWSMPASMVSGKIIWPWNMAWRLRKDTLWGGKIQPNPYDRWVTEDEYLVLKLKGETDV